MNSSRQNETKIIYIHHHIESTGSRENRPDAFSASNPGMRVRFADRNSV